MRIDTDFAIAPLVDVPSPHGAVLHLVGRITDAVFSFLWPATTALAEQGVPQTVVLIDDPLHRHLLPRFHASVRLVTISVSGGLTDDLGLLLDAYCAAWEEHRPSVTHLHGLTCSLLGLYATRFRGVAARTYFSPHGSRLLGPARALTSALFWTLSPADGPAMQLAIASSGADRRALEGFTDAPIELLESPVAEAFFDVLRQPPAAPLIIACGRDIDPSAAVLFAQCAVLLADQAPAISFAWLGDADAESAGRLEAANVALREVNDDVRRACDLASSTVFIGTSGDHGFPVFMAEAMAAGVPCVAWDTPYHRDVIRDGETGFLCADVHDVMERVAELLESAELRERIGAAAREEARLRFDGGRFRQSLLRIYGVAHRRD